MRVTPAPPSLHGLGIWSCIDTIYAVLMRVGNTFKSFSPKTHIFVIGFESIPKWIISMATRDHTNEENRAGTPIEYEANEWP